MNESMKEVSLQLQLIQNKKHTRLAKILSKFENAASLIERTFCWISHGLVMAATSHAVIIIALNISRWLSCFQSADSEWTSFSKLPLFL